MNTTKKKFLAGLVAATALVGIGAMAPKAADAVYSSPVSVMNTSANSVPNLDTEKLARIPYESTVSGAYCPNGPGACEFYFTPAPAGYRLVVENLAGYFQVSSAATAAVEGYIEDGAALNFHVKGAFAAPLGQSFNGFTQAAFNTPTRFYGDPGESFFAITSSVWSGGATEMTASGYLENCSITGCPPVQH